MGPCIFVFNIQSCGQTLWEWLPDFWLKNNPPLRNPLSFGFIKAGDFLSKKFGFEFDRILISSLKLNL